MSLLSAVKHDCGHAINRLLPKNTIIYILEMPTACHFSLLNLLREQMLTNCHYSPNHLGHQNVYKYQTTVHVIRVNMSQYIVVTG